MEYRTSGEPKSEIYLNNDNVPAMGTQINQIKTIRTSNTINTINAHHSPEYGQRVLKVI